MCDNSINFHFVSKKFITIWLASLDVLIRLMCYVSEIYEFFETHFTPLESFGKYIIPNNSLEQRVDLAPSRKCIESAKH